MTTKEFSDQFDVLYNSVMSNQAPSLDEYEKSVFLTKAQYEIMYAYLSHKGNKFLEGIEGSPKRHIDFSNLLVTKSLEPLTDVEQKFDSRSICYEAPKEMFIPINEKCIDQNGNRLIVVPLDFNLYDLYMSKPYQYPVKRHVWRLFTQTEVHYKASIPNPDAPLVPAADIQPGDMEVLPPSRKEDYRCAVIELIGAPGFNPTEYTIRYVKRARPIILQNLAETGLTIEGKTGVSECELDPEIHEEILQRAVELAKAVYTGDLNTQLGLGNTSATNLGVVPQSNNRD